MPIMRMKITDSKELLKKHFLCCNIRSELYLNQNAETATIKNAVDNGWLRRITHDNIVEYYIADAGKK